MTTNNLYRLPHGITAQLFLAGLISMLAACSSAKSTTNVAPMVANGKAVKTKRAFRLEYGVAITINASPQIIWAILTNAQAYPQWNTTIDSIKGTIALGEKIKLHAKISPKRAFGLKVSEFNPAQKMVWSEGNAMFKGVRTFTLESMDPNTTVVTMSEVFTGAMLPMIKGSLPDFTNDFETFMTDLKKAAESK